MKNEDKEIAKLQERAKAIKAVLQRKQQERKSIDEEDPELLSVQNKRSQPQLLKRLTPKSEEEIMDSGSPEEVAYLFYVLQITRTEEWYLFYTPGDKLKERLGEAGMKRFSELYSFLVNMHVYTKTDFEIEFYDFQKNSAFLGRFIAQIEEYNRQAEALNRLYKAHLLKDRMYYKKAERIAAATAIADNTPLQWANMIYDEEKGIFRVELQDIIKNAIADRVQMLQRSMKAIKVSALAFETILRTRGLKLNCLPYTIAIYLYDIKNEGFIKSLYLADKYLRSNLNERIANGEKVSDEDIATAVFPDYFEIEVSEDDTEVEHYIDEILEFNKTYPQVTFENLL